MKEIRERFERGYTLALYGTRELLHEQMREDISSLLILFSAKNKNIESKIEMLKEERLLLQDTTIVDNYFRYRIKELTNLLKL